MKKIVNFVFENQTGIESNSIQRLVGKSKSGRIQNGDSNEFDYYEKYSNDSVKSKSGYQKSTKLKRVFLSTRDITCNDGSQAGFYLRKSPGSKRWIVFLEGGWHCYDQKSCKMRWSKMR
jgi:hypothetical protein